MMKASLSLLLCLTLCAKAQSLFITNPHQVDGFGSQFQQIICAVLCAELTGRQFIYSPFVAMEHNYDNDPQFLAKKEEFINFKNNFAINPGKIDARRDINYKPFLDNNAAACAQSATLKKIKTIFRANKNLDNYFNNNNFNIALHVRRFNQHDNRREGTNTADQLFLSVINQLRTLYKDKDPLFHIYSQGSHKDFKKYCADDVVLHLNEAIEDTFLGMVVADALVTSPSSLSYTAALLSDGIVYYIPFWHSPLPHWLSVHDLVKTS